MRKKVILIGSSILLLVGGLGYMAISCGIGRHPRPKIIVSKETTYSSILLTQTDMWIIWPRSTELPEKG